MAATPRLIVLRHDLDKDSALEMIERRKTRVFKSLLKWPKSSEVHLNSLDLYYEAVLSVSARYRASYFRRAVHPIKVDHNVSEVVLGEGVFPIRTKSSILRALSGRGKNTVDLKLEEHVHVSREDTIHFDRHGRQTELPHKTDSESVENYPRRVLERHGDSIRRPGMTAEDAAIRLREGLAGGIEQGVRDLDDEFVVRHVTETYVPVFEARLSGPGRKAGLMRIDAARKKVL